MILCLDIGNTHIYGGLYKENQLQFQFRYPSSAPCTSDQLGIFLKMVLRENEIQPERIGQVAICSVVPSLNYTIRAALLKYFSIRPFFLSVHNAALKIAYKNPDEIGADRISNAIAAVKQYPDQNILVIDLGTATTFDAINKTGTYLGGIIIPGIHISMKALSENTAKLSSVNIVKPENVIGQTTAANIQSGLYYSHLGAAREIIEQLTESIFEKVRPIVIGTGGFAYLFEEDNIFTAIVPELVLDGLHLAIQQQ